MSASGKKIEKLNVNALVLLSKYIIKEKNGDFVLTKTEKGSEKIKIEYVPIGEKWVSVTNLPVGTKVLFSK